MITTAACGSGQWQPPPSGPLPTPPATTPQAGCDFRGANLKGANFAGANLARADFRGAKLKGANFAGADLRGVDLANAECNIRPNPAGSIRVRNLSSPGAFEVRNTGSGPTELAWRVEVERKAGDGWHSRGVRDLYLIEKCGQTQDSPCVKLEASKSIRPVAWTGFDCTSQCGPPCRQGVCGAISCYRNVYGHGTYRLVVFSCKGSKRIEGPPFELPARSASKSPVER